MMQVVTDSTLLRYLIEIEAAHVLPALFGQITTPPAVIRDFQHVNTPIPVRTWIASPPQWFVIQTPPAAVDPGLNRLGAGEREAISLAYAYQPALLVTDDRRARRVAEARGLRVVGTVWVLELAAQRGLVNLPPTLARLLTTNIRVHPDVIQNALARDAARKGAEQEESTDPQGA